MFVKGVHLDDYPNVYYTICPVNPSSNFSEKQTLASRIRPFVYGGKNVSRQMDGGRKLIVCFKKDLFNIFVDQNDTVFSLKVIWLQL